MVEPEKNNKGFLSGIKVLDLADEKASFSTKLLADMGARVIKVERPGGDSSRWVGPFWGGAPHCERSLSFCYHNMNKLGITLDMEREAGRDIFLKLVKRSDIVVESFLPGYLTTLGLDFECLSRVNPRLILASVSGFGQKGPRRGDKSCDLVAAASGGQMFVSGSPMKSPLKSFGEQAYYTASLFAAFGVLLALRMRRQNGRGEHLDISLQESVASTLEHVMIRYFHDRIIPQRQGGLHWNNLFCILPCRDGHIHMTPFERWETLVGWLKSEDMAEDLHEQRWHDPAYRLKNIDHVLSVFRRWTKTHTRGELFELAQLMRFPWAPVHSIKEVANSDHLKERGFFVDVEHPIGGVPLKCPGPLFRGGLHLKKARKGAPLVGEDNVVVYQKELGITEKEYERLLSIKMI
ncbi:MAG: CoA transferase [Thermodesulfobacteriota bacterium]|nr:CoA transferase [Thermodesulfobacteriota bacterium]